MKSTLTKATNKLANLMLPMRRKLKDSTESLPHILTEQEIADKAKEIAECHADIWDAEAALKLFKQTHKEKVERWEGRRNLLTAQIHARQEYRETPVEIILDFEAGQAVTFRKDTGERVSARALEARELQERLNLEEKATKDGVAIEGKDKGSTDTENGAATDAPSTPEATTPAPKPKRGAKSAQQED